MSTTSLELALTDFPAEQTVRVWGALSREGIKLFTATLTTEELIDLIAEIEGFLGIKSLGGVIVGEMISRDGGIYPDLRERLSRDRI